MSNQLLRYKYICVEGNIGAGKTSLASKLAGDFNGKLILEQFEDNPFLPKFYKDPAKYAFQLELSFLASRFQQVKDQLAKPDLFRQFVVSDYFINKSLIFARKTLQDDEFALFNRLFHIIISTVPRPELLIYLYVDVNRLQQNIRNRGRSYEQAIEDSYLEKIQAGYLEYLRQLPNTRILLLDTNKLDFVANKNDYQQLIEVINTSYEPGLHRITF
ncbi:MAG TPA: deoxynucleoside kinase [Bacteroidales bacterium]|nr:deoxynucleoside kinase [Bacteroidales bacterium]